MRSEAGIVDRLRTPRYRVVPEASTRRCVQVAIYVAQRCGNPTNY